MSAILPISSTCHSLLLPPMEKDDRLNLNVRTGSASTLYNSLVFTFGGLTIGLDLSQLTIPEVIHNFNKANNHKLKNIEKYMSGELFYLDLIEKLWQRVKLPENAARPSPRLFHEILVHNNHLYVFGGLVVNESYTESSSTTLDPTDILVPSNEIWDFDLEANRWEKLYPPDNADPEEFSPTERFCHKMTSINSLSFVNKPDHSGIFIAGGKDINSSPLYDNLVFDLVDKKFTPQTWILSAQDPDNDFSNASESGLHIDYFNSIILNINNQFNHYFHSEIQHVKGKANQVTPDVHAANSYSESLVVYSPVKDPYKQVNPLLSFKIGNKSIKPGKILPVHRKVDSVTSNINQIIPYNLRYPTGGLFGQNLIITGFLANDYDISIFIFNKPTGKWSRLNIYCNHDYGSHRFWGGYAWQSHHKVILIGNYVTSRTTSLVRYFNCLITVSLPITNILASSELAGGGHYHDENGNRVYFDDKGGDNDSSDTENELEAQRQQFLSHLDRPITPPMPHDSNSSDTLPTARRDSRQSVSSTRSPRAISFSEYVHYAAPTTNFTTIRSVFPPAAVTLGRNFLDRFGDLVADFELISVNGDRIPVSLMVLIERWGAYFIQLLARGYVSAVERFDQYQKLTSADQRLLLKSSANSSKKQSSFTSSRTSILLENNTIHSNSSQPLLASSSQQASGMSSQQMSASTSQEDNKYHLSLPVKKPTQREVPHFRLPFQDSEKLDTLLSQSFKLPLDKNIDPCTPQSLALRKDSSSSYSSLSSLINSSLSDIPPQLPLPTEAIPPLPSNPSSFKSSSRRNLTDMASPRGSLMHTLTALRSIPMRSPRGSPFNSPRPSVGNITDIVNQNMRPTPVQSSSSSNASTPTPENNQMSEDSLDKSDNSEKNDEKTENDRQEDFSSFDRSGSKATFTGEPFDLFDPFDNALLNFEKLENGTFQMESSLIPRKLYIPFASGSVKAFCEYLYTGQIGNKWLLTPTTLDNLNIAKHFKVPLLYDLICEVFFGIVGRKESWIVKRAKDLKTKYYQLLDDTGFPDLNDMEFPLDEYEGFMDTVDDGYLDIALLRKTMKNNPSLSKRDLAASKSSTRKSSRRSLTFDPMPEKEHPEPLDPEDPQAKPEIKESDSSFEILESSTSENDDDIGYLDAPLEVPNIGPRSKSIFDRGDMDPKSKADFDAEVDEETQREIDLTLTLEQLVSPISPIPSSHVIDLIAETVTLVADLKLMLRVNNVKRMSKLLDSFEKDINAKMDDIKRKYSERETTVQNRDVRSHSTTSLVLQLSPAPQRNPLPRTISSDSQPRLHPTGSSTSLASNNLSRAPTINNDNESIAGSPTPISHSPSISSKHLASMPLERARTNSSLRAPAISALTPFSKAKTEPKLQKETNKDIDKRITKLIRKDEKLKQKMERDEKLKLLKDKKKVEEEKKKQGILSRTSSMFFDAELHDNASVNSAGKKQKHGILSQFGLHPKPKKEDVKDHSEAGSVHSKSSSNDKKKLGLFGLKK